MAFCPYQYVFTNFVTERYNTSHLQASTVISNDWMI